MESRIITTPDTDAQSTNHKVLFYNIHYTDLISVLDRLTAQELGLDIYLYNTKIPDPEWLRKVQDLAQLTLVSADSSQENLQFFCNCVKYSTTKELLDILWQNFH
mgnify:FL=1